VHELPIDPLLGQIASVLAERGALVLAAPPGAGKTTRVPRALLDRGDLEGDIVVLEPRRIAARLAAERVASELGEQVGKTVGFVTRFERAVSKDTRIRFVTEGILSRRLVTDPLLRGTSVVLLDEFHERHLQGDVALAWLARLRAGPRPDLRVLPMSATLDAEPIAEYLGAPSIRSEGRAHPVTIEHLPKNDERPLASQVASAVRRIVGENEDGDVLVFLPGAREIRLAAEACATLAREHDLAILPLYGSLSVPEQDRAVRPGDRRKVILSTNVAETSVTIDGVVAVVDSGLALIASVAPWSGMPTLRLTKIAKASADQRAGRAGRTRPGTCLRLYTSGDFAARPSHESPEIRRLDLSETLLELVAAGISDPSSFGWFESPDARGLRASLDLLGRLGATKGAPPHLSITEVGKRMLRFPVHPRQARMLVESERLGVARDGARIAALVGERSIRSGAPRPHRGASDSSDLVSALSELDEAEALRPADRSYRGFDPTRVTATLRVSSQLERLLDLGASSPGSPLAHEKALLQTILTGYPDRVGRLRRPANATGRGGIEIVWAEGRGAGTAILADSSVVQNADLIVAVDAEERNEGTKHRTVVRLASAIDPDFLLETLTDLCVDETEVLMSPASGRVEEVRSLRFGSLVLEETRGPARDLERASRVLAEEALKRGASVFGEGADTSALAARVAFLRTERPDLDLPEIGPTMMRDALAAACVGKKSLDELRGIDLSGLISAALPASAQRALRELAPERVTLPGGRLVNVDYSAHAPPSIGSRLQDFFGMADGPRIVGGRVPLVLHLLAPNHRAVQVTTDLAGFWERHYPAIAKELRRKYPRHAWPDDPARAEPPAPMKPRTPGKRA
jgi:ATP-dependent helicase HrpB